MEGSKVDILVVDDHQMVREGLISLLERLPDMGVIEGCASGEEAVSHARVSNPRIIIMDVMMKA